MTELSEFLQNKPTEKIAQELLGMELVYESEKGIVSGFIVETEAYFGVHDPASFAYEGKQNDIDRSLFEEAGTIFMYKLYGNCLLDVVTQSKDKPEGVMIRAIEPSIGLDIMQTNRAAEGSNLSNGPGKLTAAMGIVDLSLDGETFNDSTLSIEVSSRREPAKILAMPRKGKNIGIPEFMVNNRFVVEGNPYVSDVTNRGVDPINNGWMELEKTGME